MTLLTRTFLVVLGACLIAPALRAQDATRKQVPAGTAATITPSKITSSSGDARHQKMLDAALTPETRQTLQEAMDSVGESNAH
jgi:hypothetical protein